MFKADVVVPVRLQIMISDGVWASEMRACQRERGYGEVSLWVALNINRRILKSIQGDSGGWRWIPVSEPLGV